MTTTEAFETWFQAIELGDGDVPLPQPGDGKRWDEYVQRHGLALAAMKWATERAAKQVSDVASMYESVLRTDGKFVAAELRHCAAAIRGRHERR